MGSGNGVFQLSFTGISVFEICLTKYDHDLPYQNKEMDMSIQTKLFPETCNYAMMLSDNRDENGGAMTRSCSRM